jgi:hypothetical protein
MASELSILAPVALEACCFWVIVTQGRHARLMRAWRAEASDRGANLMSPNYETRHRTDRFMRHAGAALEELPMALGPSYPLTHAGIVVNAPRESGVFAVAERGTYVYVGETDNLQRRLLEYFREAGATPAGLRFQFERAAPAFRRIRQLAVIRELRPTDNPLLA